LPYKYIYGYCLNYLKKEFNSLRDEDIDNSPNISGLFFINYNLWGICKYKITEDNLKLQSLWFHKATLDEKFFIYIVYNSTIKSTNISLFSLDNNCLTIFYSFDLNKYYSLSIKSELIFKCAQRQLIIC